MTAAKANPSVRAFRCHGRNSEPNKLASELPA